MLSLVQSRLVQFVSLLRQTLYSKAERFCQTVPTFGAKLYCRRINELVELQIEVDMIGMTLHVRHLKCAHWLDADNARVASSQFT